MADPEGFDADPDPVPNPTSQADADPDPDPNIFWQMREKKFVFQVLLFFISIIFQNLPCVIFSLTTREEGRGVRDKV